MYECITVNQEAGSISISVNPVRNLRVYPTNAWRVGILRKLRVAARSLPHERVEGC